jgi:hypothetical protein
VTCLGRPETVIHERRLGSGVRVGGRRRRRGLHPANSGSAAHQTGPSEAVIHGKAVAVLLQKICGAFKAKVPALNRGLRNTLDASFNDAMQQVNQLSG